MKTAINFLVSTKKGLIKIFIVIVVINLNSFSIYATQKELSINSAPFFGKFRENKGQWDSRVRYQSVAQGWDANVYFLDNGLSYCFQRNVEENTSDNEDIMELLVWNMYFENTSVNKQLISFDKQGCNINYIKGGENGVMGIDGISDSKGIEYINIYDNVDIKFYNNGTNLKYDYVLHKGADLKNIKITCEGVQKLEINSKGDLIITTPWGKLTEILPESYQLINEKKINVNVRFKLFSENSYGFFVEGNYNKNFDLIVDPVILDWSTYVGATVSTGHGYVNDVVVDNSGYVYCTGFYNDNFPITPGVYDQSFNGGGMIVLKDAFVFKLTPDAKNLVYCTYIGGSAGMDEGVAIKVNGSGEVYVFGNTQSSDFPSTLSAFDPSFNGGTDAFFIRLSASGSNLLYGTFIGGAASAQATGTDIAGGIDMLSTGAFLLTGKAGSANFPVTAGVYQNSIKTGTTKSATSDAFLFKLNPSGNGNADMVFSTFIGGNAIENGFDVKEDGNGNIILLGSTASNNFPTTTGAFDNSYNDGGGDAFVCKLNSTASTLLYSTFLGGAKDYDNLLAVDVDALNQIFVTGTTRSNDYPVTNGAFDNTFNDVPAFKKVPGDIVVSKINPQGNGASDLIFSTFVGGTEFETARDIEILSTGEILVSGYTLSNDFPVNACSFDNTYNNYDPATNALEGYQDFVFFSLDASGSSLIYSTYIGGNSADYTNPRFEVYGQCDEHIVFCGTTHSNNFPTTTGVFQANKYNLDKYDQPLVYKFKIRNDTVGYSYQLLSSCNSGAVVNFFPKTTSSICSWKKSPTSISSWLWDFGDGSTSTLTNPVHTFTASGVYNVKLKVGCPVDSVIIPLIINLPLPVSITTTSIGNAKCFADSTGHISVNVNGGTGLYNYSWTPANANSAIVSNLSAGIYTLTVTDKYGCSDSASYTIKHPSALTAHIPVKTNVSCYNEKNGSLSAAALGGTAPYTYTWNNGVYTTKQITGLASGSYFLEITDSNGCRASLSEIITQPNRLMIIINSPLKICEGESIQLSVSAAGGTAPYIYSWAPSVSLSSITSSNPVANPLATTFYKVNILDANGCEDSSVAKVIVNPKPNVSFYAVDTIGCGALCTGIVNASPGILRKSVWDISDGNSMVCINSFHHCFNSPGIYSVTLTVTDTSGCSNTLIKTNYITVNPNPVAAFSASPSTVSVLEGTVYFTNKSLGETGYSWNFGDVKKSYSNVENPSHIYNDTGLYLVTLIVTNEFGCLDTAWEYVKVTPDYSLYVPNTFTPNGDGLNDIFLPVGIFEKNCEYKLSIFDRWGNLIFLSTNLSIGWDGRANGGTYIAQQDTYVWKLELIKTDGRKEKKIGRVSLVR